MFVGRLQECGRVEREDRRVQARADVGVLADQRAHRGGVTVLHRVLEPLDRRTAFGGELLDPVLQLTPAREAVLAREHVLGGREGGAALSGSSARMRAIASPSPAR
jgi:hypothetical protein